MFQLFKSKPNTSRRTASAHTGTLRQLKFETINPIAFFQKLNQMSKEDRMGTSSSLLFATDTRALIVRLCDHSGLFENNENDPVVKIEVITFGSNQSKRSIEEDKWWAAKYGKRMISKKGAIKLLFTLFRRSAGINNLFTLKLTDEDLNALKISTDAASMTDFRRFFSDFFLKISYHAGICTGLPSIPSGNKSEHNVRLHIEFQLDQCILNSKVFFDTEAALEEELNGLNSPLTPSSILTSNHTDVSGSNGLTELRLPEANPTGYLRASVHSSVTGYEVLIHRRSGLRLIYCPGGSFWMGLHTFHCDERPVHLVRLSPFLISETAISFGQYEKFMADAKKSGITPEESRTSTAQRYCSESIDFQSLEIAELGGGFKELQHYSDEELEKFKLSDAIKKARPVTGLGRSAIQSFLSYYRLSLPTEAQWEYVARGPWKTWLYPWSWRTDSMPTPKLAQYNCDGKIRPPCDVKHHLKGVSPFGAYEMAGNVWEWCADWYGPFSYHNEWNPTGPHAPLPVGNATVDHEDDKPLKVLKGGSIESNANSLRATTRGGNFEGWAAPWDGFRPACQLDWDFLQDQFQIPELDLRSQNSAESWFYTSDLFGKLLTEYHQSRSRRAPRSFADLPAEPAAHSLRSETKRHNLQTLAQLAIEILTDRIDHYLSIGGLREAVVGKHDAQRKPTHSPGHPPSATEMLEHLDKFWNGSGAKNGAPAPYLIPVEVLFQPFLDGRAYKGHFDGQYTIIHRSGSILRHVRKKSHETLFVEHVHGFNLFDAMVSAIPKTNRGLISWIDAIHITDGESGELKTASTKIPAIPDQIRLNQAAWMYMPFYDWFVVAEMHYTRTSQEYDNPLTANSEAETSSPSKGPWSEWIAEVVTWFMRAGWGIDKRLYNFFPPIQGFPGKAVNPEVFADIPSALQTKSP